MTSEHPALAVIGCGRTASTVAAALCEAGHPLAALTCRTERSAALASDLLSGAPIARSNREAAAAAPVVLIGVPDGAIAAIAGELAEGQPDLGGRVFLHLAGALDSEVLAPLRDCGAATGSLHPLQTFPERIASPRYLAGVSFGIEGDPTALDVAVELVRAVGGRPLRLRPGSKAHYHAGAAVASNHLTTLLDLALRLLAEAGIASRQEATEALLPLVLTTLAAIERRGPAAALTGPVVRGDDATVARHLARLDGAERRLYVELSRATLDLARRSRRLDEAGAARVEAVLEAGVEASPPVAGASRPGTYGSE